MLTDELETVRTAAPLRIERADDDSTVAVSQSPRGRLASREPVSTFDGWSGINMETVSGDKPMLVVLKVPRNLSRTSVMTLERYARRVISGTPLEKLPLLVLDDGADIDVICDPR